jgi:hypothetical protein
MRNRLVQALLIALLALGFVATSVAAGPEGVAGRLSHLLEDASGEGCGGG